MALNAVQRLEAEDRLITLIGRAIILCHPHRERMAQVTLDQCMRLSDDRLTALCGRLEAWIAEQQPPALTAPVEAV